MPCTMHVANKSQRKIIAQTANFKRQVSVEKMEVIS